VRGLIRTLLTCTWLFVLPVAAFAQASIAGVVKDASGAVLPGVTVEAASPALIEKVRVAATDGSGQYTIVDLRPGTYAVTFTLPGFSTVKREGIVLTGSFVATVNTDLRVGSVEETITVTGETPIVDVQSTKQQRVLDAELIAAIPTGRSLANLAALIPGMIPWSPRGLNDVGGTDNLQNTYMSIHGGRAYDQRTLIDGILIGNILGTGTSSNFTADMGSTQEVTVDTAAGTGDQTTGGVKVNYVPRDGGNKFRLSLFATGANSSFQGSNLTQDLIDRGLGAPNTLKRTYDVNPTGGGPIVQDKLWFYSATRFQTNQNYVAGSFENKNAGNPNVWTYEPDLSRQGLFAIVQKSANTRITWQAAERHKITGFFEKQWRTWDDGAAGRAPEAFVRYRFPRNQIGLFGWTSPLTNRLLVEARGSYHAEIWANVGADEVLSNNRQLIPVQEQGGSIPGLLYRTTYGTYARQIAPTIWQGQTSVSYVTGSHAFKVGADVLQGTHTNPTDGNIFGLRYRFNNGVPNLVTEDATPFEAKWTLREAAIYAQDKWTLNRWTMNYALRFDYYATTFPATHLGPGTLVPQRDISFPETPFYRFKDVSPRLGVAYDLSGNGRTALKASLGRYVVGVTPTQGHPVNNLANSVTRSWTDADRDYVPDCDLANPLLNGECGRISDLSFGSTRPSTTYDNAIVNGLNVRPVNWESSVSVQHQIHPRVGATAGFFHRRFGQFIVTDNRAVTASDYTGFSVTAPVDPRLPGGGGYTVSGLYDLNPDKVGAVDNYVTSAGNFGEMYERWSGVDIGVDMRLPGLLVRGGFGIGRTTYDNCEVATKLPEMLGVRYGGSGLEGNISPLTPVALSQCHVANNVVTQAKWVATYTVPRIDVQVAGTVQSMPGTELQANWVAPNAEVQPSLGRPLSGGAVNKTVSLLQPGTMFGDRLNQLDFRVSKLFRLDTMRTAVNFDLYNALNANPVTILNMNYAGTGAAWQQPQGILPARLFKLSVQFDF
jgi:Carboxypeptidase regulatory-like domain